MRVAPDIVLSAEEQKTLERLARSNTTSVRLARRANIILLAAAGLDNHSIAAQLNTGRVQVGRWRQRYAEGGLAAIEKDLPRGGRKKSVDHERIIELTTQTKPENATHWSTRRMAEVIGVSPTTVLRTWATKYRYQVLDGEVGHRCRELLREIAWSKEIMIYAGSINRDHVHILIGIPPNLSVSKAVQYLKGKSSHKLLSEYGKLRKRYWSQHLWAERLLGSDEK